MQHSEHYGCQFIGDKTFNMMFFSILNCSLCRDNAHGHIFMHQIGTNVFLKSWKNRNKNVVVASIVSCDPTRKVAGIELGTEYLMVHVHFPLAKYEELIRPYKGYKIIGNVVGLDIAWPAIFVRCYFSNSLDVIFFLPILYQWLFFFLLQVDKINGS